MQTQTTNIKQTKVKVIGTTNCFKNAHLNGQDPVLEN